MFFSWFGCDHITHPNHGAPASLWYCPKPSMRWCAHLSLHNFHTPHQRVCASNAFQASFQFVEEENGKNLRRIKIKKLSQTKHRNKRKNCCFFFFFHILIFWLFGLDTYSKFQLPWYPNQTPHKCTTPHKNKNKIIACRGHSSFISPLHHR